MTRAPKTITKDKLAAQALHLMESNSPKPITVLPVIDEERRVIGLLHMTDWYVRVWYNEKHRKSSSDN